MKIYRKIPNIFEFDNLIRKPIRIAEPFLTLKDIQWVGTEKIDGTNIRVYWDGYRISIAGRKDNSEIPPHLKQYLTDLFLTSEMESVFEQQFGNQEVYLFGEGCGAKIQQNGELYSEAPQFILFDAKIGDYDLSVPEVDDLARHLGLKSVSIIFYGTLNEAIEYVKEHHNSVLNPKHEMEGVVLTIDVNVYDQNRDILKCKCKWKEVKEWNN